MLLHGSGANSVMWMGDVAAWATQFRVYSVDVIGEPGLSAPARPALDSDAHALWLDDVLRELALARASFVGLSLGGWLALDYAIRRPERVERLALLCPGGVGRQRPSFLWKVLPLLLLGRWGRRRAMALALGATEAPTTPAARAFGDYFALIHTHFRPRRDRLPVFSDAALRGLAMPVLAIAGGRDALLDSLETKRRLEEQRAQGDRRAPAGAGAPAAPADRARARLPRARSVVDRLVGRGPEVLVDARRNR